MTDTLDTHQSANIIKLLNIGESGSGKSGQQAALVIAGYTLWLLDYDNGIDIIRSALVEHYKNDPAGLQAAFQRVHFRTLRDTITFTNGIPKIKPPVHAYKDAGKILAEWKADEFGPNDVLSLDSLTTFSEAAFNEALSVGGRLNQRPQLQDYGWLSDSVKLFIEMLTSDMIKCHVIVNTHIRYFSGDAEEQTTSRGLPNAKGQEISRVISRYFNTVVLSRTFGNGPAAKRVLTTQPQGVVEVKTSNPFAVQKSYPVETGLADLFRDILGHGPVTQIQKQKAT